MKKIMFCIMLIVYSLACLCSQEYCYDPWGPWNKNPIHLPTARIRTFNNKNYYMAWESGIRIMENYNTRPSSTMPFNAIVDPFDYIKIEKYEKTGYGFLFTLIGKGFRDHSRYEREWKENIRIQVKMIFISSDECRFEYISKVDENGFHLPFLIAIEEGAIYRRYRVDDSESEVPTN